ncbi:pilus assembly protein PilP [Methylomicrobium sp. Wu6]|uniref:pilus assembly protein PilP n=1 Tax=Methylomicrobium sp. Wu6 TaxID=3107928 RepID=UPI002DD6921B|nr:pilus assembly protein PilP [Methylomicrobium sp. Wu6]MEC4749700.1 pilus assembly protein PilP [Methylomicrobium sp. Wu6]
MKSHKRSLWLSKTLWMPMCCACCIALLTACANDDLSDLKAFVAAEKAKPKGTIDPLPEIKVVEPFIFNPDGLRDPFTPLEQAVETAGSAADASSGIKPDLTRPKEELEAFSLDSLRMVGTVNTKSGLWGLVKAVDSTVYRVKVGNYMGKNYGKIIRIVGDKIELMELISDKPGSWHEQQASLALAE